MRWWSELKYPRLKCERVGHAMYERRVDVILDRDPGDAGAIFRRYVAVEATEVTPTCSRCGHVEEMRLEDKRFLTGLTTTSDRMRALRRDGRIVA